MKKSTFIILLLLSLSQLSFSQEINETKVVFYRENLVQNSSVSYKVYAGDSILVRLKNNSYFVYYCKPGDYRFKIDNYSNTKIHLRVERGKTYYLNLAFIMGNYSSSPELLVVDRSSAELVIRSSSIRQIAGSIDPIVGQKNRIGLKIENGGGFQNNKATNNSDGSVSKISFGGGFCFGLKYGREFTKHFDLSLDLNYQGSSLNPPVDNGDMTFDRAILSITPAYIISVNSKETVKLKIGAGLDDYFGSELKVEGKRMINGFNDTWKYANTLGYHFSTIFEFSFSEKWSIESGLKWYNVSYSFKKGISTDPTDPDFINPDGSGFDFLVGVNYHF